MIRSLSEFDARTAILIAGRASAFVLVAALSACATKSSGLAGRASGDARTATAAVGNGAQKSLNSIDSSVKEGAGAGAAVTAKSNHAPGSNEAVDGGSSRSSQAGIGSQAAVDPMADVIVRQGLAPGETGADGVVVMKTDGSDEGVGADGASRGGAQDGATDTDGAAASRDAERRSADALAKEAHDAAAYDPVQAAIEKDARRLAEREAALATTRKNGGVDGGGAVREQKSVDGAVAGLDADGAGATGTRGGRDSSGASADGRQTDRDGSGAGRTEDLAAAGGGVPGADGRNGVAARNGTAPDGSRLGGKTGSGGAPGAEDGNGAATQSDTAADVSRVGSKTDPVTVALARAEAARSSGGADGGAPVGSAGQASDASAASSSAVATEAQGGGVDPVAEALQRAEQALRDAEREAAERRGHVETAGDKVIVDENERQQTLDGMLPMALDMDERGLFEFDRYELRNEVKSTLDVLAEKLKSAEYDRLVILGYTDRIGTDDYNQQLSDKRAWAVAGYLMDRGVPPHKLKVEGRGERDSVTNEEACEGLKRVELIQCLQRDRRVEIAATMKEYNLRVQ